MRAARTMSRFGFAAIRERLAALVPKRVGADKAPGPTRGKAGSKASEKSTIPVRDWIDIGKGGQPTRLAGFDQALVCVVIALLAMGVVMVYSASVAMPDNPKFARYAPTYFMSRQILFVVVSLIAALVTVQVPVSVWEKASPWVFVASLLLLVLVLIPFIGKGVNGAHRWIPVGPFSFQP